jgi:hypothetical protein
MFAPKVAKPQTKATASSTSNLAHQRSTLVARPPSYGSVQEALLLQRTLGNQAMPRVLAQWASNLIGNEPGGGYGQEAALETMTKFAFHRIPLYPPAASNIQTQLAAGTPGDIYEREADRVADEVTHASDIQQRTPPHEGGSPTDPIREATKGKFQTESATSSEPPCAGPAPAINNMMSSSGRPLDADTRKDMEFRFGHDFSHVRVHTDSIAARSAETAAAIAYTFGPHVVFSRESYDPASRGGQRLLAHELTHVLQQGYASPRHTIDCTTPHISQRPVTFTRSPLRLAAQPDPLKTGGWNKMRNPAELSAVEPDPIRDEGLGLRVVNPAEIEAHVRWILSMQGGWVAAQARADFKSSPSLARLHLEHSHWRTDDERLLYARFYFEQFMSAGGEAVDNEALVKAMVQYEVRVQSPSADLVLHDPITDLDRSKLDTSRKDKTAKALKQAEFEAPLAKAREAFFSNQDSSFFHAHELLYPKELEKVAAAVIMAARDFTSMLPLKFFEYYSEHFLIKMKGDEEKNAQKKDTYALTDSGGNTRLRTDVIGFPEGKLGPILLHELGHTQDIENAVGLGDYQEGHGYAIEYFLSKDAARKDAILELLSGEPLAVANQRPKLRLHFKVSLATLIALNEVIQTGSSPHLPAQLLPSDSKARETASQLMAERVEQSEPSSKLLLAITQYVTAHLDAFDLPSV